MFVCLGFFGVCVCNCLQLKERKREERSSEKPGKRCKPPKLPAWVKVEPRDALRRNLRPFPRLRPREIPGAPATRLEREKFAGWGEPASRRRLWVSPPYTQAPALLLPLLGGSAGEASSQPAGSLATDNGNPSCFPTPVLFPDAKADGRRGRRKEGSRCLDRQEARPPHP